jgi:hypothetical protein
MSSATTTAAPARGHHARTLLAVWAPAAVLLALWLLALPATQHYGNPDGPSYASVAELWAAGEWSTAVNAYWGPLLSWLAAPLVLVGVDPLFALRLVLLLGALATLPPLRVLALRAGASSSATTATLVATAPFLVYASQFGLYADVLMAAALLRSLQHLTDPDAPGSPGRGLRAGAWAGVAFLARAYAAPVALVALPLGSLLQRWGPRPASLAGVGRLAGLSLLGFLLVAGSWSAVLSVAYGEPTYSTSAGFNTELVAPGSAGNPYNVRGLYPPPRDGAVSAWEEPSRLPVPRRGDADQREATGEVGHRLDLAVANARIVVGSLLRRGAPFAALALFAVAAAARRRTLPDPAVTVTLLTAAVFAGGLTLVIAIERYLWTPILLTVPAAAVGLDLLVGARRRRLVPAGIALALLLTATSAHGLLPRLGAWTEVTAAAEAIDEAGGLDGWVATADSWQRTHLLCHRVGCQYVGRPEARTPEAAAAELRAAGVDHLVVWAGDEDRLGLEPSTVGTTLVVFSITDDGLEPALRVAGR